MTIDIMAQLGDNLDQQYLDDMNKAMQDGGGIQLPFAAVNFWARNGDKRMAQLAQTSPVSFFGGWNCAAEQLQEMGEAGLVSVPLEKLPWQLTEQQGDEGAYHVFETRVLHLAPIAYRLSWLSKDGKNRTPQYDEGHARSHLQYLCLIGTTSTEGVKYLCPGVISVKGKGQTEAMKNSIATWKKIIDQHRKELNAQRLPLCAWWISIGTTGDKPEFVTVGSGKQTSDITPVRAIVKVDKTDAEYVAKRFVGAANFTIAAQLLKDAHDWLNAWKQPAANGFTPEAPATDEDIPW